MVCQTDPTFPDLILNQIFILLAYILPTYPIVQLLSPDHFRAFLEGPPLSTSDRGLGAGLALGGGYLPDLVKGAFFLTGTGSGSGFDSDTDSDPVSLEF